jgi:hypothetical protein
MMPARRRRLVIPALALALVGLGAAPVAADCQMAGPLEDELQAAEVAFVGTTTEVIGSMALFEVHEVWAGSVGDTVEVHGLTSGVEFSEDDRRWEAGTTYLVLPYAEGGVLRDSICTATTVWRDDLAALRPAAAVIHASQEPGSASLPIAIPIVAVVLAVVALVSVVAFRRRPGQVAGGPGL